MLGWLKNRRGETRQLVPTRHSPQLPLDLAHPGFVSDPYPTYAWLREHVPVAELGGGGYLLTRHSDIMAAFTHSGLGNGPSRFSTLAPRNAEKYVAADLASHIPPFLDAPEHKGMRQMVSRAFFATFKGPGADLDELATRYVAELATGSDLITLASQPFSIQAMCRFCGISGGHVQMKMLTNAFFHLFAPLRDPVLFEQVNADLAAFRALIGRTLDAGPPEGSLLAHMRAFQSEHGHITDAQIVDNCLLVFADGVENIEAGAASLMSVFEGADIWEDLRSGAVTLDAAVREGLRLQTPAQLVPRVARAACEIGGIQFKKDMPVFLALASGNRDPEAFEHPDLFDPSRDLSRALTFGQGRHRCIGEPLGIAQLVALVRALISRGVRPMGGAIEYQSRIGHRWPRQMRIKIT